MLLFSFGKSILKYFENKNKVDKAIKSTTPNLNLFFIYIFFKEMYKSKYLNFFNKNRIIEDNKLNYCQSFSFLAPITFYAQQDIKNLLNEILLIGFSQIIFYFHFSKYGQ